VTARRLALVTAALTATVLGVATWVYLDAGANGTLDVNGYVLTQPRALPAVELVDERAERFRSADFAGHWSFVYFGYTYCPDVCPLTLVTLASLKGQLTPEQAAARIEYYLVSVDPHRDTPERLREYVAYFDSNFHGLTGSPSALAVLAQATETLFGVPEDQDPDHYLVSHSSNVVLLDPHGDVHAVFTPPHDPARLAADFTRVAARYAAAP